jgi:hypothetical protein
VIAMSCVLALTGCQKQSPYLREVKPSYDEAGQPMPGYATLPIPYLEHMLADLDVCYKEEY